MDDLFEKMYARAVQMYARAVQMYARAVLDAKAAEDPRIAEQRKLLAKVAKVRAYLTD